MNNVRLTKLHAEAYKLRQACQRMRAAALQFELAMSEVDRELSAITPRRKRKPAAEVLPFPSRPGRTQQEIPS